MTELAHQRLIKPLLESLDKVPLHQKTLSLLENRLKSGPSKSMVIPLAQMVSGFENTRSQPEQLKKLESIIHHAHFVWSSPMSLHLRMFQSYYSDLLMHWPYEQHRSLLSMERPKSMSLRYNWENNHKGVISKMQYKRNKWVEDNSTGKKLTNMQRDLLFHSIFAHYYFLKTNSRLCKNGRNLPVPIVEIPMRPLGNDIAASRIKNIFKTKVAYIYRILAKENPVLTTESETLLQEIINEASNRKQRRLYQATCRRAYVIEYRDEDLDERFPLPQFRASSLLLNI